MPFGTSVVRCHLCPSHRRSHSLQLLKAVQVVHKRELTASLHFIPSAPCVPPDPHLCFCLIQGIPLSPSSKTAHLQLCCPTFPFATLPCKRPPLHSLTLSSFLMPGLLCSHATLLYMPHSFLYLLARYKASPCIWAFLLPLPSYNSSEVAHRPNAPPPKEGREQWGWGKQLLGNTEPCLAEIIIPEERGKAGKMKLKKPCDRCH